MLNKRKHYIILVLSFFSIPVSYVFSQGYELLAPIPTVTDTTPSFVDFLKGVFVAGVGLAIIGAVIMIILGAMGYILAAVPSAKADGKKKMTDAIFGLLILLISTIILITINPDLMRAGLNLLPLVSNERIEITEPPKYCFDCGSSALRCFNNQYACWQYKTIYYQNPAHIKDIFSCSCSIHIGL